MNLHIDPEFKALIPSLSESELAQLRDNILKEGIRDALVTWGDILLDGHNRYTIALDYDLPFSTTAIDLPDRDAARLWIVKNQLGRRNLTPQQASYLRGKWYNEEKQDVYSHPKTVDQNDPRFETTADRIASQTGVSAPTVKRDAKFAEAVDEIAEAAGEETRDAILKSGPIMSKTDIEKLAKLAQENPDAARAVIAGEKSLSKAKQEIAHSEKRERPLPTGKYAVIYADPPWRYENSGFYEGAESQYPTMALEDICALPIAKLIEQTTVLFLWATNPLLPEALMVMRAWGFEYKTNIAWIKDKGRGKGWFLKSKHELLLIGVRPETPHPQERFDSCFEADRGDVHSRKPERAYEIIEAMYPGAKIELFARNERDGWECWGNE